MHESEKVINENGSVRVKENKIIVRNPIWNGNFPITTPPTIGSLVVYMLME